jgi:hypothetical protein
MALKRAAFGPLPTLTTLGASGEPQAVSAGSGAGAGRRENECRAGIEEEEASRIILGKQEELAPKK